MSTKTFELTVDERDNLCRVLEHVMETNSNSNMEYEGTTHMYVWSTPEAEQEQEEMQALHDKLKPKTVEKCGWIMKERLLGEVWMKVPYGDEDKFQFITWDEEE